MALKKKLGKKKVAASVKGSTKAAKKTVKPTRGRTTKAAKIEKRLKRAGKSSINTKSAVYAISVVDLKATTDYEGQLLADNGSHVIFRHKKSRGGSRMRVSHFLSSDIVNLYGDVGEAASITVREPKTIMTCEGTVKYDEDGVVLVTTTSGETQRFRNREDIKLFINVDEDTKGSSSKSVKKGAKKRRAAKVDDDDFQDD